MRRGFYLNPDEYTDDVFIGVTVPILGKKSMVFADTYVDAITFATKTLGLTNRQADKLFFSSDWPEGFDNTPKGAANRIRHFIKTGK